ncbi:hypothetical protein [Deinococcus pimensis]|uniref:hypothetical protein n=1 Tax=Deinococcus pimensis TaxID=309888 RepID=UPI000482C434|nr:hypothetical protein [Deinococcus pimensis]
MTVLTALLLLSIVVVFVPLILLGVVALLTRHRVPRPIEALEAVEFAVAFGSKRSYARQGVAGQRSSKSPTLF